MTTLRIKDVNGDTDFQNQLLKIVPNLPKAFGYSIEVSLNINILNFAGAYGKAGVNYVVYPKGDFSWFPFEYVYAGYSLNFVLLHGELKETIENLLNVKKAKDLLKLAGGGGSAGVSPFVAWKINNDITPISWEGWFVANTLSVKARAGLGITVGGSVFAGTYEEWGWEPNFNFEKAKKEKQWYGGTIDVGVAGGTPAIEIGLIYASRFWLMDSKGKDGQALPHSWKKDGLAFGIRWYQFIKLKPDAITFFENITGMKFPKWLKNVINIATSFAMKNKINSMDDYYLASNKNKLDLEYKEILESNGYDNNFFASLDKNDNSNMA